MRRCAAVKLSRRDLLRAGLLGGGVAAAGVGGVAFPSLSGAAVAPRTTLNRTLGPGAPNALGYSKIVAGPGEVVRVQSGTYAWRWHVGRLDQFINAGSYIVTKEIIMEHRCRNTPKAAIEYYIPAVAADFGVRK